MFILKGPNIIVGGNQYVLCSSFTSGGTELWHKYCTVVTDADITQDRTLTIVNKALRPICTSWESIRTHEPLFSSANVVLVLDIVLDGAGKPRLQVLSHVSSDMGHLLARTNETHRRVCSII